MTKYAQIYDLVSQLTDDLHWRAFFISYLLAETNAEREMLNDRFWQYVETLDEASQQTIREGFDKNFRQIGVLVKDLHRRVDQLVSERTALAA